jgi:hypothetical protein
LFALSSGIVASILGVLCLLWYAARDMTDPDVYILFGIASLHVVAAIVFYATARSGWRWLMLLITLPCAFELFERAYSLWSWSLR